MNLVDSSYLHRSSFMCLKDCKPEDDLQQVKTCSIKCVWIDIYLFISLLMTQQDDIY